MKLAVKATLTLVAMTVCTASPSLAQGTNTSSSTSRETNRRNEVTVRVPSCDARKTVTKTQAAHPAAVTQLRYVLNDGSLGAWASGSLIAPHTVLTCGHCVYDRSANRYNQQPMTIMPGAYRERNRVLMPFGESHLSKVNEHKRTNKKYRTIPRDGRQYDYGALHVICPFNHLQTYVPLAFKSPEAAVRLFGYPLESLPTTLQPGDMVTGAGLITLSAGRQMLYDVRSTGGASGGPVFVFDGPSRTLRQVGINTFHTHNCNGGGVRLQKWNRDLIVKWMKWKPSAALTKGMRCRLPKPTSWTKLKQIYAKKGSKLRPVTDLNLQAKPAITSSVETSEIYQFIRGTLYHWKEYRSAKNKRYIRMLAPAKKWLSVGEGRVLLTASAEWLRPKSSLQRRQKPPPPASRPIGRLTPIPMPTLAPPARRPSKSDSKDVE